MEYFKIFVINKVNMHAEYIRFSLKIRNFKIEREYFNWNIHKDHILKRQNDAKNR